MPDLLTVLLTHQRQLEHVRIRIPRFPHEVIFIGHYHRWFAATPQRRISWDGTQPIELKHDERFLVIIHAVMYGRFAIYDDFTNVLTPMFVSLL